MEHLTNQKDLRRMELPEIAANNQKELNATRNKERRFGEVNIHRTNRHVDQEKTANKQLEFQQNDGGTRITMTKRSNKDARVKTNKNVWKVMFSDVIKDTKHGRKR